MKSCILYLFKSLFSNFFFIGHEQNVSEQRKSSEVNIKKTLKAIQYN